MWIVEANIKDSQKEMEKRKVLDMFMALLASEINNQLCMVQSAHQPLFF